MRVYRNLLRRLLEAAPDRLVELPPQLLSRQAAYLLRVGDIYSLDQLNRSVDVVSQLDRSELRQAALLALMDCRVDDFCFLFRCTGPGSIPADAIAAAYLRLARRGKAAGIEDVSRITGLQPRVDEATAIDAYKVLIGAGRLGAADYIRQLSGIPVVFEPEAVRAGARALLAGGSYEALGEFSQASGAPVRFERDELLAALRRAFRCHELRELEAALREVGAAGIAKGFCYYFAGLRESERWSEVAAIFRLCADADAAAIGSTDWRRLLDCGEPSALKLAYTRCGDEALLRSHAPASYRVGVQMRDRELVQMTCERGGVRLRREDAVGLLADALDDVDISWVAFAYRQIGRLKAVDGDLAQLFLANVRFKFPARLDEASGWLGTAYDEELGGWLYELGNASELNIEDVLARLRECERQAAPSWLP